MAEFESVIKRDFMLKRSLMKGRLKSENFRERWFLLSMHFLRYCDGTIATGPDKTKGLIELANVLAVETVKDSAFERPNFFQIVAKSPMEPETTFLYVQATCESQRDAWIRAIRNTCQEIGVQWAKMYHSGVFKGGKYTCCLNPQRLNEGCSICTNADETGTNSNVVADSPKLPNCSPEEAADEPQKRHGETQPVVTPTRVQVLPPVAAPTRAQVLQPVATPTRAQVPQPVATPTRAQVPQPVAAPTRAQVPQSVATPTRAQVPESVAAPTNAPVAKPRKPNVKSSPVQKKVVALYPYAATDPEDLSLKKGEEYEILEDDRSHWWKAKNKSGQIGFIPSNYVQIINENGSDQSLRKYDWYYPDTSMTQAEAILKQDGRKGCFLVRNSRQAGMYSLSLLTFDSSDKAMVKLVKNYHIKKTSSDGKFCITESQSFSTIPELVTFHKTNAGGLATKLESPPKDMLRNSTKPTPAGLGHEFKEIRFSELTINETVGTGQFGIVVRGTYKGTVDVAVKMVRPNCLSEEKLRAEAKTMATLHHKNLVQLYGLCTEAKPMYIVTEFMKRGSLLSYLRRHKHKIIRQTMKLLDMGVQVCAAMEYLESVGFVHHDLAARNCLIGETTNVKVADFGIARFVIDDEYKPTLTTKFPIRWSAPEVLSHSQYSNKSDVWSFGVLLWEIFTCGNLPYEEIQIQGLTCAICDDNVQLTQPDNCPESVFQVISRCWAMEPKDRPKFSQLQGELDKILLS